MIKRIIGTLAMLVSLWAVGQQPESLPSSKLWIESIPGDPYPTNSFPSAVAVSPDHRHVAILNNGYGTAESFYEQSIAIIDINSRKSRDYPDSRFYLKLHQTYFLGLAFSRDGSEIYASVASLRDPEGKEKGSLGNGIAVYSFAEGRLAPKRFIPIPLQPVSPQKRSTLARNYLKPDAGPLKIDVESQAISYPAGLATVEHGNQKRILVAGNLADNALLLDVSKGEVVFRFDLSMEASSDVPASYPYGVVALRDGKRAYCSLWNASEVAELDLENGKVVRRISVLPADSSSGAGSHPNAMVLSKDERVLFVALANRDQVAMIDTASGSMIGTLHTELPFQKLPGAYPNALALSSDETTLFVANGGSDAVAVFHVGKSAAPTKALGFIPTEWYPTGLAVIGDNLFILTGKGRGSGANFQHVGRGHPAERTGHPYILSLMHGSVARVNLSRAMAALPALTQQVQKANRMQSEGGTITFPGGRNPFRHVIYIIKENRTYDQILGDLKPGNGDPSLVLFGEDITPNQHKLARQFGIIDNFYDSGEVSGIGHTWSTAAITSDYTEKTIQIGYRDKGERTYDYEGEVSDGIPLSLNQPDINEPATGYLWTNAARHGLSYRQYAEYIATRFCDALRSKTYHLSMKEQTDLKRSCPRFAIAPHEKFPQDMGDPPGSENLWPWDVPLVGRTEATKPELVNHFDPLFANFKMTYPDQLRAAEFLKEFKNFVASRPAGSGEQLPALIIMRLPNDHTSATTPGEPTPEAAVADNDLALGRIVEAVSHSPYWDDTAILVVEDDAQDGGDHVDAHRSTAFVISKYSPGGFEQPFVAHEFFTTVSLIRTIEDLLGLPPMNNNDAHAPVMASLFTGNGGQPPFVADYRNRDNKLIYQANKEDAPGAKESAAMDFSQADRADAQALNTILWKERRGNAPVPVPKHNFLGAPADRD